MIKLSEIEKRCNEATKGPWEKSVAGIEGDNYIAGTGPWYRTVGAWNAKSDNSINDADFIAQARTDLPEALRLLREAREIIETLGIFQPDILKLSKVEKWLSEVQP